MENTKLLAINIIFILGFSNLAKAEEYIPMVVEGNQWNELILWGPEEPNNFMNTSQYMLKGDSIVDGIKYVKMMSTTDSLGIDWRFIGLIREDIQEKKVYYKQENNEFLLYDFGLKTGDFTLITIPRGKNSTREIEVHVSSTDAIIINDTEHIRYFMKVRFANDFDSEGDSRTWIQGIGCTDGIFSTTPVPAGGTSLLLCFLQQENLIYKPTPSFDECFYWKDEPISISKEFYKNVECKVINKKLYIEMEENIRYDIDILNLQGVNLLSRTDLHGVKEISLNQFENGIYLVNIISENGFIIKKIKL